jgi:predicted transcriptional regulator
MPSSAAVRVDTETRDTLKELARESGRPIGEILADAVHRYRRAKFLAAAEAAYAARGAQDAAEDAAWDATLADGLPEA